MSTETENAVGHPQLQIVAVAGRTRTINNIGRSFCCFGTGSQTSNLQSRKIKLGLYIQLQSYALIISRVTENPTIRGMKKLKKKKEKKRKKKKKEKKKKKIKEKKTEEKSQKEKKR